jgi:hypothetical protein
VAPETLPCQAPSAPACAPQLQIGAPCDPVCQVGTCAWCTQKCSYAANGQAVCSQLGRFPTGSSCTVSLAGTPEQYDNCAPGNICLSPEIGSGLFYCFALCRSSLDCVGAGVACSGRVLSASGPTQVSVTVCDPPYRSCAAGSPQRCCDPLGGAAGCDVGQFCYLVPPDPSGDNRTVCDYTTGGGARGVQCTSSRECMSGWTCYGASPGIAGVCRMVCDPMAATPCGTDGGPCLAYGKQFGVCSP